MLIGDASKYFEMCIIREFIFIYGTCDVCDMASVCVCVGAYVFVTNIINI